MSNLTLTEQFLAPPGDIPAAAVPITDVRTQRSAPAATEGVAAAAGTGAASAVASYQVQVEVRAVGLNFADVFAVQGYVIVPLYLYIQDAALVHLCCAVGSLCLPSRLFLPCCRLSLDRDYICLATFQSPSSLLFSYCTVSHRHLLLSLYSATPRGAFVPGLEFAGVVSAVPAARAAECPFRVGDRVMGVTRFSALATLVNADVRCIFPVPATWTFAEAAAFLVQGLTAAYALHSQARVKRGEVVLVHSAAGGVGLAALRLCQRVGAHPIATVGSPDKAAFLLRRDPALHVNQVIDRSQCGRLPRARLAAAAAALRRRLPDSAAAGAVAAALTLASAVVSPVLDAAARVLAPRARESEDFALLLDRACAAIEAKQRGASTAEFASVLVSNETSAFDVVAALLPGTDTARAVRPDVGVDAVRTLSPTGAATGATNATSISNATVSVTASAAAGAGATTAIGSGSDVVLAAVAAHGTRVRGVDVVLDSLLGATFPATLRKLAPEGRVVVFGAGCYATPGDGPNYVHLAREYLLRPTVDPMDLIPRNVSLSGFNLIWLWEKLDELPGLFALLVDSLVNAAEPTPSAAAAAETSMAAAAAAAAGVPTAGDGVRAALGAIAGAVAAAASAGVPLAVANPAVHRQLRALPPRALATAVAAAKVPGPHVGKTFPFAQLPAALAFLQSGRSVGKVVVTLGENDAKKLAPIALRAE